jgi:hypothetical protein
MRGTWPSTKTRVFLSTLFRIDWSLKRISGSFRTLARQERADFISAFHDSKEFVPR